MFRRSHLLWQNLILLQAVYLSVEIQYELEFEDDQLFTKCLDKPDGFQDITGLFDFSNFTLELSEEGIVVRGNLTTIWDVDTTDRIEAHISILHLERGIWQPTILNVLIYDYCKVMYDKNQLWYKTVTQHVINVEEVQSKCVKHKGTLLVFEPYLLKASFGVGMELPPGRNRIIISMVAIDSNKVARPNGICFECVGEFFRIKK